jgi:hypothetical protein
MELSKIETQRQEFYKRYEKAFILGILILIIAVVIIMISLLLEFALSILLGILLTGISIIFFSKANKHYQDFRTIVKESIINSLLESSFENVCYEHKNHISVYRINQTEIIRKPDRYSGEDLITGTYKNVYFEVSDINLKQRVQSNKHVSYQTYFKGRWYIFKLNKTFQDVLKMSEGSGFNLNKKGLVKMDTESILFNQKFSIFTSSLTFGFYIITPTMIEKLLELEKMHQGSIHYAFIKNELHVGVNDNKDYMELSIAKPINFDAIQSIMSDIDLISAIINELKLDSQKFNH